MLRHALAAALLAALTWPAGAGGYGTVAWSDLGPQIFGERAVEPAGEAVTLEAPYRAANDARVPVEIRATAPGSPIVSVSVVIDGNPMPVAAVFDLAEPQERVRLGLDLRFNGPSPVRAVIETADGRLLMAEGFVKTSGLGTCSAPPVGDPDAAIAAIGGMEARLVGSSSAEPVVELAMAHPQHTGMQMDQVTLHYILARYVDRVAVAADGTPLFSMRGSISLSEDPAIRFALPGADTARVSVRMEDTEGTVVERALSLLPEG